MPFGLDCCLHWAVLWGCGGGRQGSLNEFMAMGKGAWAEARQALQWILSAEEPRLRDDATLRAKAILHKARHTRFEAPQKEARHPCLALHKARWFK